MNVARELLKKESETYTENAFEWVNTYIFSSIQHNVTVKVERFRVEEVFFLKESCNRIRALLG